jgi:acyl carrier protein
MTSTEQIYARLTDIFHEVFDDQSIVPTPEMKAGDVPEWDSLNHINLIVAIEARFKIKFKSTELESLRNVGHLVELIDRKLNAPSRG